MEVDTAATTWIERYGTGSVSFLTLTMPHDHGEKLADLLQTIRVSFAAIVSGEAWQTDKERYGLRFYIVAYDATVGVHGWHPHLHIMLFGDRALDNGEVRELGDRLYSRWVRAVTNRGHRAPTRANGLQFERAHRRGDLARYVCQIIAGDQTTSRAVYLSRWNWLAVISRPRGTTASGRRGKCSMISASGARRMAIGLRSMS